MIEYETSIPGGMKRTYTASCSTVAAKRFLNYLRRYREERPTLIEVTSEKEKDIFSIEWYQGKFKWHGVETDAEGTWWRILAIVEPLPASFSKMHKCYYSDNQRERIGCVECPWSKDCDDPRKSTP